MDLNNLFKQCLYFCILLIIFTFSLSFISSLWYGTGATGTTDYKMGNTPASTANESYMSFINNITGLNTGFSALWLFASIISAGGVFVFAAASHQTTPVAVWLFGEIFWTCWIRAFSIPYIPSEIAVIFTTAIMFVFAGAVIGILGYSG
jgi:hypothetical protein